MILLLKKIFRLTYYRLFEGRIVSIKAPAELSGRKWITGRRAGYSYTTGQYEPPVQEFLRKNLSLNDSFLDIGAHVGFFSLFADSIVGPKGMVVSFEPDPNNFSFLAEIHRINGAHPTWHLEQLALSDSNGQLSFVEGETSSTGRLGPHGTLTVNCSRADSVWISLRKPAIKLIKIDVEGCAGPVLTGALELLQKTRPIILVEIHSNEEGASVLAALPDCYFKDRGLGFENAEPLNDGLHFIFRPKK